ncbi:MAG: hypothetical protein FWD02_03760 [Bacteroidales bacterium]|nr:hypothetical protein [Bacteroidales bacterium]
MKSFLKYVLLVPIMLLLTACSEERLVVDPNLNKPLYDIPEGGPPGSLAALMREFYDRYTTVVRFDFPEREIRSTWTGQWRSWYVPAEVGSEPYGAALLSFLLENLYGRFADEFVRRNLPYKIFLVDSLRSGVLETSALINVASRQNAIILGNVGSQQAEFTDSVWEQIRVEVQEMFIRGFYDAAPSRPAAFILSRSRSEFGLFPEVGLEDPLGEYTSFRYRALRDGFVRGWMPTPTSPETGIAPGQLQDFADFTLMIIQEPATEITNLFTRFPLLRQRALILVPFLQNVVGLDVVTTQNNNHPGDPLPADFFQQW